MRSDIAARLEGLTDLPTLPAVVMRMVQSMDDPALSIETASRELGKDQCLTAKILRLVNSPFYGFSGRISSLAHAVTLLGINVVRNAILSLSILHAFPRNGARFNPEGLWEHAIGSAVAAQWLGIRIDMSPPEDLFVAGLLHDIGSVFFLKVAPEDFAAVMEAAAREGRPLIEVEREHLGVDHAEIGGLIARQWRLPDNLTQAIVFHHEPFKAPDGNRLPAVISVADALACRLAAGGSKEASAPVDEAVLGFLQLSRDTLDEGAAALEVTFHQAKKIFA
jgi:HD-like signal output (HDOD) protein